MAVIHTIGVTILVILVTVLAADAWQDSVTIYASTCELPSGKRLPTWVCREIVNYRYLKDND
jgi:hypothetical protein